MKDKDLNDLLKKISSENKQEEEKDAYDYAGYGVIENLKLSREELQRAITIMWDICMELDKEARDQRYLFGKGLSKSKEIFLTQFNDPQVELPEDKIEKFRTKLENIKPLVEVLIKLKEVI